MVRIHLRQRTHRIREADARGTQGPKVEAARQLLESLPAHVAQAQLIPTNRWMDPKDRTLADTARIRMLKALTALAGD